jgi:hypothetical protein
MIRDGKNKNSDHKLRCTNKYRIKQYVYLRRGGKCHEPMIMYSAGYKRIMMGDGGDLPKSQIFACFQAVFPGNTTDGY